MSEHTPGPWIYRILCLSGCGEHFVTNDAKAAWDEANAHERALDHDTRVVTLPKFERRRQGEAPDGLARTAIAKATGGA